MPVPAALAAVAMTFTLTKGPMIINLPGFSVRDIAPPIFDDATSTWHMYATVINASEGTPGYYGEIGHFYTNKSVDEPWTYDGIVVSRGPAGEWDCTGVFTPGAVKDGDTWIVFFGGVGPNFPNHSGGDFSEWQGIATSQSPFGPFIKSSSNPTIRSSIGPSPLMGRDGDESCNITLLPPNTNIVGGDLTHSEEATEEDCQAACCAYSSCQAFTFTSSQPHTADNCRQGSPCCWLKGSATSTSVETDCTSGVRQPAKPNGTWAFIRLDNPLPMVSASGQRLLMMKAVALNFTALMNIYLPQNGTTPSTSWDPPYVEYSGNPITHPSPAYEAGFENEEVFAGPDGLLHMIGNSHGAPGNPHLIADPNSSLLVWHELEVLHGLSEPAPIAYGGIGAASKPPLGFTLFEKDPNGTLAVWFESIEWKPANL